MGLSFIAPGQAAEPKIAEARACRAGLVVLNRETHRLSMRLRAFCPLGREQFKLAFAELKPSAIAEDSTLQELSVEVGRIVEHPWLSAVLARAALNSKEWDRKVGKPRQRNINQYVGALLRASGVLDKLVPGWALRSAAAEKVLVQPASRIPELGVSDGALVPYDAIVWLHFVPEAPRPPEVGTQAPAVNPPARLDE